MTDIYERVVEQFSGAGSRADIWRGFDLFLPTDEFLNLGYSGSGRSHLVGSPQQRLAEQIGLALDEGLPRTGGVPLLDVGCGRGGPALRLRRQFGFDVTGLDLVSFNVATARQNALEKGLPAEFVVGDATRTPFADDVFRACTAIDAIVYVPDKAAVFAEVARVLEAGGWVVCSDLVRQDAPGDPADPADTAGGAGRAAVDAFADSWDMAPIPGLDTYLETVEGAGLAVESVRDVSASSVDRFEKWARLYLALADRFEGAVRRALHRWDLDYETVTEQVRRAREALPHLRHVIVRAQR